MNLNELVKEFFHAESVKQKVHCALMLHHNLTRFIMLGQRLESLGPEQVKLEVSKFLVKIKNGEQAAVLPTGYSLTADSNNRKAIISSHNELMVLWKLFGNSEVVSHLNTFSMDDHGPKIQNALQKYSSNLQHYLSMDVINYLLCRDQTTQISASISQKLAKLDTSTDRHRLWATDKLLAQIWLVVPRPLNVLDHDAIALIYGLIYIKSLPVDINSIFCLLDLAVQLQSMNSSGNAQHNQQFLADILWINLAIMLKTITDSRHDPDLAKELDLNYKFNNAYVGFLLPIVALFCINNVKDKHQRHLLEHCKKLMDVISGDQKLTAPAFMYLKFLTDQSISKFSIDLISRNPEQLIICQLYRDFVNFAVQKTICFVVPFLADARYQQSIIIHAQADQITALAHDLDMSHEKCKHLQKTAAQLQANTLSLRSELFTLREAHKLQIDQLRIAEQKLTTTSESLTKIQAKQKDLTDIIDQLNKQLTEGLQDLTGEITELAANTDFDLKKLEPIFQIVKLKIISLQGLFCATQDESSALYVTNLCTYLNLILKFLNFVFKTYMSALKDILVESMLAEIQTGVLNYAENGVMLEAIAEQPFAEGNLSALRILYHNLLELANLINQEPVCSKSLLKSMFHPLCRELSLSLGNHPLLDCQPAIARRVTFS